MSDARDASEAVCQHRYDSQIVCIKPLGHAESWHEDADENRWRGTADDAVQPPQKGDSAQVADT